MRITLRSTPFAAAFAMLITTALQGQTTYSLSVGGESFLVGPCSGNAGTGTFLSGSAPVAANAHCGPAGGTIDASGFANPGKLGANLALSEGNGGNGGSTVSFLTHVVFSSIDPNASQAPIAIALNAVVGGQIYAGPSSSNGAWSTILSLGSNNFSFSHSINAGDPTLYPNGANSLTFTNGGETGTVSAGTATDTVSGILTTPALAPVGLGTPILINVQLSIRGFGNPGSFGGNMVLTCPVGADLFTLPPGYTANDPDIHLVNNRCVPPVLYSWGSNGSGQLGNGTTADSSTPVQVVGPGGIGTMQGVIAVSGGGSHSLALTDTGAVYAWGDNSVGQLGIGSATLSSSTPVQVSLPGGRAIAVAAGKNHSLALMDDLTVYSWGGNLNGQAGDGGVSPNIFTPVKVQGPSGSTPLVEISAIAAGNQFSAALVRDGTVYTWGANLRGQLGNGSTSDHLSLPAQVVGLGGSGILNVATGISVSATSDHVLVLTNGQTVYAWGEDLSGELGIGTTGTFSPFPVQVKDMAGTGLLSNISAVADGGQHSLALSIPFDTIYAWGDNAQNELGNNSNLGQSIPGQVLAPGGIGFHPGIAAVQAGGFHNLASTRTGALYAWGAATHGQLGDGNISAGDGVTPVQVLGLGAAGFLQYVSTFAAGNLHSLAVAASPAPAAPPDLTITKTHVGNFTQGQGNVTYTITVSNAGNGPTSAAVTVNEMFPVGLNTINVGNSMTGLGWTCPPIGQNTCTRSDALAPGASYPPLTVTTDVAENAPASVTNIATVSGGGDINTANNTASDPTTILPAGHPDLAITKTHVGNFTQGQGGVTYTITVSNVGNAPAFGGSLNGPPPITVVDTFPVGLIGNAGAAAGQGWNCDLNSVCSRSDALAPGASYPPITMTVSVAANAPASLTNVATVSGGGDINTANNTASDPTTILPAGHPDLAITKTHVGNFTQGQGGVTYTITVSNVGNAPAFGGSLNGPPPITVVDTFPVGLIGNAGAAAGQGWNCDLNSVCSRSDALAPGASYPPITMTVSVAANAPASLTNVATVSGGGDINTANNTASDPTTILPAGHPDLAITKTHVGNFTQGQGGVTYTITVSNVGNAPAFGGSLNGPPPITVVDTFPVGLIGNAGAAAGQGWNCDLNSVCSRSDALAPGASYPPITMTVSVAANAPASLTNVATVSGGGDINTANNTASDPTTILPAGHPDLAITKTHNGNFTAGLAGTYTITVTNAGTGPTTGTVTVQDLLPSGLTAIAMAGAGWNCTSANTTCTRNNSLTSGGVYPPITVAVLIASNAPASLTNSATVAGGGEVNTANDTANDPTSIVLVPDLSIAKTHVGNLSRGKKGIYDIEVRNVGGASTTGTVTVVDLLPAGLTAVELFGTGWNCHLTTSTCTRNDALPPGAGYPVITFTVNVAANATSPLRNRAAVVTAGDTNPLNNLATDTADLP